MQIIAINRSAVSATKTETNFSKKQLAFSNESMGRSYDYCQKITTLTISIPFGVFTAVLFVGMALLIFLPEQITSTREKSGDQVSNDNTFSCEKKETKPKCSCSDEEDHCCFCCYCCCSNNPFYTCYIRKFFATFAELYSL